MNEPVQMMKGGRVPEVRPLKERDEDSMRSLEIAQIRILARKRPKEFRKVAAELFDMMVKA